jgi:hypothetical protein
MMLTRRAVTKNITETICHAPIRDGTRSYLNTALIFGVASAAFVLLRIGFKVFAAKMKLGPDDWFILITIFAGVPSMVIIFQGTTANGLGKDVWTLPFSMITNFLRFFFVMEVLYFAQITLLKTSLLFFYLRIFPAHGVRKLLWFTMILNCLVGLIFIFISIFQCSPISYFWDKWDGEHQGTW